MKNKEMLMVYIFMELAITVGMLFQHNYYAATGWGFLMLTNIDTLIKKRKKDKNE